MLYLILVFIFSFLPFIAPIVIFLLFNIIFFNAKVNIILLERHGTSRIYITVELSHMARKLARRLLVGHC